VPYQIDSFSVSFQAQSVLYCFISLMWGDLFGSVSAKWVAFFIIIHKLYVFWLLFLYEELDAVWHVKEISSDLEMPPTWILRRVTLPPTSNGDGQNDQSKWHNYQLSKSKSVPFLGLSLFLLRTKIKAKNVEFMNNNKKRYSFCWHWTKYITPHFNYSPYIKNVVKLTFDL